MVLGCSEDVRHQSTSANIFSNVFVLPRGASCWCCVPHRCVPPLIKPPISGDGMQKQRWPCPSVGPQRRSTEIVPWRYGVTDWLSAKCLLEAGESTGGRGLASGSWPTLAVDFPPKDAGTHAPPPSSQSPAICFSILELIIALDLQRHSEKH